MANHIRDLRKRLNVRLEDLADLSGISPSYLSRLEAGKRPLKFDHVVKIANALKVSLSDISDNWNDAVINNLPNGAIQVDLQGNDLPVIGRVAAGNWLEIDTLPDDPLFSIPVPQDRKYGEGSTYALLVEGTSINRTAREGDVLVCLDFAALGAEPRDNELVIVERRKRQAGLKEVTAKRFRRRGDRIELWPDSDDPRWQTPIEVDDGSEDVEVAIVGYVLWIYRKP